MEELSLNGQWIGEYTGTNQGHMIFDVDDVGTHFEGRVYAYDSTSGLPATTAFVQTANKDNPFEAYLNLYPMIEPVADARDWKDVAANFPTGTAFPATAYAKASWDDNALTLEATTNIGTFVTASLPRSAAAQSSELVPMQNVTNWEEFKHYVSGLEPRAHIFRGQKTPKRLRTSFHRRGRADLVRFQLQDIQTLQRHLSSRITHIFNFKEPDEYGAFLNLVQHHGYPTPVLDWTYSPFVAAFFAYRHVKESEAASAHEDVKVRILMLDKAQWSKYIPQLNLLRPFREHFSVAEFIGIENVRLVPQQSVSTVTNVDDIESYIRAKENQVKQVYLRAIDLPWAERTNVMRELQMMGITAGSLFPGIDGACEELRERYFKE